jgi:hypothetical protein
VKIIISHDVDHITVGEHSRDLIVPKIIVRNTLELIMLRISPADFIRRFGDLLRNKWQNIAELTKFNLEHGVPSTFFIGINNGVGLSYRRSHAEKWIQWAINHDTSVGIHGIAYRHFEEIKDEYDLFSRISKKDKIGIRMHYLRLTPETLQHLAKSGYTFDSSVRQMTGPYKVGDMWEFPLHLMDGDLFYHGKRYQNRSLKQVKSETIEHLKNAEKMGIPYFSVLFHDRYFCKAYSGWLEWYKWLVLYAQENGYTFVGFEKAVAELELINKRN